MSSGVRLTIDEVKKRSLKLGLICLSEHYKNNKTILKWKCELGHTFEKNWDKVNSGYHCHICSHRIKRNFEDALNVAKLREGICLSKPGKYKNLKSKLLWECKEGHKWKATLGSVLHANTWCKICSGNSSKDKKYLEDYALSKNGKFLSKSKNIKSYIKYKWECENGHKWKATYISVINQSVWCTECSGYKPYTIDYWKKIAKTRGGECLSDVYKAKHNYLKWKCAYGHTWKQTAHEIQRGTWCPKCSYNYSEEICRLTFEQIFKQNFPKERPSWLIGPKGFNLELDGFNKKLKLAFEYNGAQHYKTNKLFKSRSLKEIQLNDKIKEKLCKQIGVLLITISYKDDLTELPHKIKELITKNGYNTSKYDFDKKINLKSIWSAKSKIEKLRNYAKKHKGEIISDRYFTVNSSYEWRCKNNHIFYSTLNNQLNKTYFCERCRKNEYINKIKKYLENNNLESMDNINETFNSNSILKYKCINGHISSKKISDILRGRICKICKNNKS